MATRKTGCCTIRLVGGKPDQKSCRLSKGRKGGKPDCVLWIADGSGNYSVTFPGGSPFRNCASPFSIRANGTRTCHVRQAAPVGDHVFRVRLTTLRKRTEPPKIIVDP